MSYVPTANRRVACEVLSLTDNFGLTSTAVIPSEEDEVGGLEIKTKYFCFEI